MDNYSDESKDEVAAVVEMRAPEFVGNDGDEYITTTTQIGGIIKKYEESKWGRTFAINQLLAKCQEGLLFSTLWMIILATPFRSENEHNENLTFLMGALITYFLSKYIFFWISGLINK